MTMTVRFNEKDLENLDNLASEEKREFVKVPYGRYEVAVAGIWCKENQYGIPRVTVRFKVVNGEFEGNSIFYNQNVDDVWKFKLVAKLLNSLKTDVNFSSSTYVFDGVVDFDAYNKMLNDVFDDIDSNGYEYALDYIENSKGYPTYTITDVFTD